MRVKDDPATRLRMLMAELDINTQELADSAKVAESTISRIRSGTVKRPTHETARRIAKSMGVKVNIIWPSY